MLNIVAAALAAGVIADVNGADVVPPWVSWRNILIDYVAYAWKRPDQGNPALGELVIWNRVTKLNNHPKGLHSPGNQTGGFPDVQ